MRLPLQQASSLELVRPPCEHLRVLSIYRQLVLHAQGGNIAEHLVANGLARVVDWHAGMLAAGGGMERLRSAERAAKEKRLKLYANAPAPAVKANGPAANGHAQNFDAIVTRVWSGDQISVAERDSGKERRIQLSSTRAPKYAFNHSEVG